MYVAYDSTYCRDDTCAPMPAKLYTRLDVNAHFELAVPRHSTTLSLSLITMLQLHTNRWNLEALWPKVLKSL